MALMFNALLTSCGISPHQVRLIRHQDSRNDRDRTPYLLWRNHPDDFMTYQSRQSSRRQGFLGQAMHWAVFVKTPSKETLFVGLYDVGESKLGDPLAKSVVIHEAEEGPDYVVFDLQKSLHLNDYEGKLSIDWGSGALAWAQYAHRHDKQIVSLLPAKQDPPFPGYLRFAAPLSDIVGLYESWVLLLREAKGVYVISCPSTKELYVGSATGIGGFYERWLQHAMKGGDAVRFRSKVRSDYRVAILEVAGSSVSRDDILNIEHLWMHKLQTVAMGLNGGSIPEKKRST